MNDNDLSPTTMDDEAKRDQLVAEEQRRNIAEKLKVIEDFEARQKQKVSADRDSWAIAELMGHVALAGRITKPGEYGGLWQIDIPEGETFRPEFFGSQAVYRIRIVSEEIARAYARPGHEIIAYNAPIVTREEHEAAIDKAREINNDLREKNRDLWMQVNQLEAQLKALPAGEEDED
jgi:hypothetical protein